MISVVNGWMAESCHSNSAKVKVSFVMETFDLRPKIWSSLPFVMVKIRHKKSLICHLQPAPVNIYVHDSWSCVEAAQHIWPNQLLSFVWAVFIRDSVCRLWIAKEHCVLHCLCSRNAELPSASCNSWKSLQEYGLCTFFPHVSIPSFFVFISVSFCPFFLLSLSLLFHFQLLTQIPPLPKPSSRCVSFTSLDMA